MDDSLEHPDDGLRDRIRMGFEASNKRKSKKIDERLKTPRATVKDKNITDGGSDSETDKKNVKKVSSAKSVEKKNVKPPAVKPVQKDAVYLCPKCDKTYKSKNGIIKHMPLCK